MSLSDVSLIRGVARVDIGIGIKNADDTWNKNGVKFKHDPDSDLESGQAICVHAF